VNPARPESLGQRGIADLFVQRETALQSSSSMVLAPGCQREINTAERQQLQPQWVTVVVIAPTGRTQK
jgi:hypothetical protein